jgi:hypothetical protein
LPRSAAGRASSDGDRTHGVGSQPAGPGSGSGGDLDPDVIGVGSGSGIAQNPPEEPSRAESTTGGSEQFASGPPARGKNTLRRGSHGAAPRVRGDFVDHSGGDASTTGEGVGSATASPPDNPEDIDDAAAGEISLDEASGADNSPSDNV